MRVHGLKVTALSLIRTVTLLNIFWIFASLQF